MNEYGYVRIAAGVPNVKVSDVDFNIGQIEALCREAAGKGVDLLVLPELCVTGYTCGDLFQQPILMKKAEEGIRRLIDSGSLGLMTVVVGAPVMSGGCRFNCAVVLTSDGVAGIVPKSHLPNYGEFYEKRWFEPAKIAREKEIVYAPSSGKNSVPFGTDLIFSLGSTIFGIEICEDLWVPVPPSCALSRNGATVILNLSASDDLIGKHDYLLSLISQQSARCRCAYVYASAGWGESSTDLVFGGKGIIAECGSIIGNTDRFTREPFLTIKDVDVEKLESDRARFSTFFDGLEKDPLYRTVAIKVKSPLVNGNMPDLVNVNISPTPFVPSDVSSLNTHCREIINIQARGLMQRIDAIGCRSAVIGISGGLDSTLALLVTVKAFDLLGIDRKGIYGITMPGEATTSRTHSNAVGLMEELGVTSLEIPIGKSVAQHFADIRHSSDLYDTTYENSQARERTQILMDYSNKVNGIVIGTGDMSELALGWCTYNGDHMSMYGVNSSVPKTLVKHLVSWFAGEVGERASIIIHDIVDTPISPELVPSKEKDEIGQKTEDLVGPYELHDFFLFHLLRNSFAPRKIYMLARKAFRGKYDDKTILKWLGNFYRRFFSQQFKRSCMPDGPKVGSVNLSPRGDWRMPSDASGRIWMREVEEMLNER